MIGFKTIDCKKKVGFGTTAKALFETCPLRHFWASLLPPAVVEVAVVISAIDDAVKPLLSGCLQDLLKCPLKEVVRLIEVVKIVQCLFNGYSAVIKLHVVKEAVQSSSSLPFTTNLGPFSHRLVIPPPLLAKSAGLSCVGTCLHSISGRW